MKKYTRTADEDIYIEDRYSKPKEVFKQIAHLLMLDDQKNINSEKNCIDIGTATGEFLSYVRSINEEIQLDGIDRSVNIRRQDLPDAFLANGAIYAVYTNDFISTKSLITSHTVPYVMSNSKSIDIDTKKDVRIVENIIISNC
jgi:argonaute-like protein implicated in RNA metabolism and viral defense